MKQKEYDDIVTQLSDRSSDIRAIAQDLVNMWGFNLDDRTPGIAYVDEEGTPVTTLDMACAMAKLVEWEPVILVPWYQAEGAATVTEGQTLTSKENRHGQLVALVSNKDRLKFSFRFRDHNVMSEKEVGFYRTFTVFDDGEWYEGFENLQFKPTAEEKQVLAKFSGGSMSVAFDTFIHTNRWPSFYGRYYRLAMYTIQRIADQLKWLDKQIKAMREKLKIEPPPWPKSEKVGASKPKEVWKYNVVVNELTVINDYPDLPLTEVSYEATTRLKKRLAKLQEILRFQTRATDYSLWHHIRKNVGEENIIDWIKSEDEHDDDGKIPMAAWVKEHKWVVGWQDGKRQKNKKYYLRMDLPNDEFLQIHIGKKTVQVADRG